MNDTLSIKDWADKKFKENLSDIRAFVADGWTTKDAFHHVFDSSTLGAGYKAQARHDLGLSIFD